MTSPLRLARSHWLSIQPYSRLRPGYLGCNPTINRLISPLLYDRATKISRSSQLPEGTLIDSAGTLARNTRFTPRLSFSTPPSRVKFTG